MLSGRFWAKVRKTESCWLWIGAKNSKGYGTFAVRRRTKFSHRLVLEDVLGRPIVPGMQALHSCPGGDNPACVNPDHLREGTRLDNARDAVKRSQLRRALGETNGRAKLTTEKVREIKAATGAHREIALQYGVTPCTIGQIKRGETWRFVVD